MKIASAMPLGNLKPYYILSTALFFVFMFCGVLLSSFFPAWANKQLEQLTMELTPLLHDNIFIQILLIFLHNLSIHLMMIFSFFLFGLLPFISLAANGIALGAVMDIFAAQQGLARSIAAVAPHGIIELPTFFLSTSIGFWLGIGLLKKVFKKEPFGDKFSLAIRIFISLLIPATFLAAAIEILVTPFIYQLLP